MHVQFMACVQCFVLKYHQTSVTKSQKEKKEVHAAFYWLKDFIDPYSGSYSHFIPPENTRKLLAF